MTTLRRCLLNAVHAALLAMIIIPALILEIYQFIWIYRAFAGGWVPLFGELQGSFIGGVAYLAFGSFIVMTVAYLALMLPAAVIAGIASLLESPLGDGRSSERREDDGTPR